MRTTSAPGGEAPAWRLLRAGLALLALLLAIAATVLLALGPLGWRAGWLHYRIGLQQLIPWAAYCGLAAAAVAVLALIVGGRRNIRPNIAVAAIALLVGAFIAYIPWSYDRMRGKFPPINDITTDWRNPPQFQAVVPLRAAEGGNPATYAGEKTSEQQRRAYPDIAPLTLGLDPPAAFARAQDAAGILGWTIVASDTGARRIEASERSRWFGFTDDVVIRVTPEGGGSRVDVRSASRWGRNDFGVNAARVRAYLAALRDAAGKQTKGG